MLIQTCIKMLDINASKYNMLTTTQNKIISYESTVHQYMIVNHAFFAVLYNIFTIFHFSFIIHSFNKIKETKKPSFYQERDILFPDRRENILTLPG